MKTIGITGGVGAGKSTVLQYLEETYNCQIIMADDVANHLKEPGQICYEPIIGLLGTEVVQPDGAIDRKKMADLIFHDRALLKKVEAILHPAVRSYIEHAIEAERASFEHPFVVVEAALLIQCGYDTIMDEMWYVAVEDDVRRMRLKQSRGYSDEKIDAILASQLDDAAYRAACNVVIDNSGLPEETYRQIDLAMRENHHE